LSHIYCEVGRCVSPTKIKLEANEISEYQFLKVQEALPLLNEKVKKRLPFCLEAIKNNTAVYLEDGILYEKR